MTIRTLTYSNKKATYNILDDLYIELEIQENPYNIPLDHLFDMAARINKKRSFLFVSKVLGKHIPIRPEKGILTGYLLAGRYMEKVKRETISEQYDLLEQLISTSPVVEFNPIVHDNYHPIIIGFAETATALGHAFFEAFSNADYFHSTREMLRDVDPVITFEEEHSHATSHRAYIDEGLLDNDREIILVDDEITTGKTALNIIRSLHSKFPRQEYSVVSILDWRSKEDEKSFEEMEKELGITISTVSLIKGTVTTSGELNRREKLQEFEFSDVEVSPKVEVHILENHLHSNQQSYEFANKSEDGTPYILETGRFGITSLEHEQAVEWMKRVGMELSKLRTGDRTLCLGTGEFMYLPMKIASFMGDNVFYHSTTRSPIYDFNKEGYGVRNRFAFQSPEDPNVQNYLYNISEQQYDEIFLFFERELELSELSSLMNSLKTTKINDVKLIFFSGRQV
ncbi:phosphoribosyltransferase family protein [Bacillus dakarensis]|uniref:phosphoribosyltransferase family protein n=1 Tax=Robertmurraya dakarensis TaxID=1926278 RepID=UPI001F2C3D0B|nr:phosphoribosyltransferase family protein [Bacillus dakarensis]